METAISTPRQLIAFELEGSPDKGKPGITISVNIPEMASEKQARMIESLFRKHFPNTQI